MRVIVCMFAVMLAGIGCSKTFMCHLNGTQCPAGQATSGGGGEQESTSEPAADSEHKEPEVAPTPEKRDCLAAGAKTDNYHRCCCDCMKTQIEPDENIHTCG